MYRNSFPQRGHLLKSIMVLAIAITMLCALETPPERPSFDTSFTIVAVHGELLPAETDYELVKTETAVLPQRGLNRVPSFPGLALLVLFLHPCFLRSIRTLFWEDNELPRILEIRGMLPLPLAPPLNSRCLVALS